MKKRRVIAVTIYTVVLLTLQTGCQTGEDLTPPAPNQKIATDNAIQNIPKETTLRTTPPRQLETIESYSADIIDDLAKSDWASVESKVDEIKSALTELKPILQSANVSASLIDGMDTAFSELEAQVASKQVYQAKIQANAITKYIPDISDAYDTVLPTDLGRLDYCEREITLNAEKNDWTAASGNLEKCKAVWQELKQQINSRYKSDSEKFDQSIASLEDNINNKDQAAAIKEANHLMELVDALEKDFSSPVKNTWTPGYST